MDAPTRGIATGTPVPSVEREAAVQAPAPLQVYWMDPAEMEAYLIGKYGGRLAPPSEKPTNIIIPGVTGRKRVTARG
ncbi:hypothetical protein SAMN05421543_106141 [Alicyclobacillus macrosporangiidus]|uniref:Uncharacterized protein n=1 Tax=Alicyclobacillus macrosporangiidus TaxID=392015 RepID=A0A1I7ICS8_9BACL|nr:hypothetical protein SAMN05421543_106141 [Alicyclobacillus macrosporangiidus]